MLSAQTIILQNKIVFVGSHFNTVLIEGWVESFLAGSGYGFSQSGSGYGFSQSGSQSGKIRKPIRVRLRIFRVSAEAVNSTNFLNCNLLWPWNPHWRLHKVKTLTKQQLFSVKMKDSEFGSPDFPSSESGSLTFGITTILFYNIWTIFYV